MGHTILMVLIIFWLIECMGVVLGTDPAAIRQHGRQRTRKATLYMVIPGMYREEIEHKLEYGMGCWFSEETCLMVLRYLPAQFQ